MRERVFFELRLSRFGVWRVAIWLVAGAAIAAVAAWTLAMLDSQPVTGRGLVMAVGGALLLGTTGLAISLARVEGGLLTCSDGLWTFVPDSHARTGTLEVAVDLGAFLLLRLVEQRRPIVWLPVQRRGVESQWHALRCAAYSPLPLAAGARTASALPSE